MRAEAELAEAERARSDFEQHIVRLQQLRLQLLAIMAEVREAD
jgi:hypothetical protein